MADKEEKKNRTFHSNRVYEVAGYDHDEHGGTTAILGVPYPPKSENPPTVRIALTTEGDAAEDKKRPTLAQIEKGKNPAPPMKIGGLISVDFDKSPGDDTDLSARWIKGIAFDPEDTAAKKVQAIRGHVFANPKDGAEFPYGLTVLSSRETLPDLKSLENVKSADKWTTGIVRVVEDGGKVTKTFTASLLPNESASLMDKLAGREDFKTFLVKGLPEKSRLDLVLFDNYSLSKETFPKGDKRIESLAFRTVPVKDGEPVRKPENRLSEMVIEFDPGSGKFVTGIHSMGPRLTPSYLVPVVDGEKLVWSPESSSAQEKKTPAEVRETRLEPEQKGPSEPHPEEHTIDPEASLPGLSEPEPVGTTASLYNDDDLSMN